MEDFRSNRILRMTFRNHLAVLAFILYLILGYLILVIVTNFNPKAIYGMGIWILLDIGPTIYLHITYWLQNKGQEFEFHFDEVIQYNGNQKVVIKVSDIDYIKLFVSRAIYNGTNLHYTGMEAYYYAHLQLTSGKSVLITCLISPNLIDSISVLRGVTILREKCFFCSLSHSKN